MSDAHIAVDAYIDALFDSTDDVLRGVEASITDAGMPQISVSPTDGRFLHVLARMIGARTILEIGTLGGYSTIWLARALEPGGRVTTIELNADFAEVARRNFERAELSDRIEQHIGRALDVLPRLSGTFDLIFIDADKPAYPDYLEWALHLSHPGTLIVADNVVREGEVANPDTEDANAIGARRFNEALANNPNLTGTIIQTIGLKGHDGMALAVVSPGFAGTSGPG